MKKGIGRYSKYLRPLTILFDVSVINLFVYFFFSHELSSAIYFIITSLVWMITATLTSFYEVFRFTKLIQIGEKALKQFLLFAVFSFAYIGISSKEISSITFLKYLFTCFFIVVFVKFAVFNALKVYRRFYNKNQRRVVVIGQDLLSKELSDFFVKERDYGYQLMNQFEKTSEISSIVTFCENNNIDELYLSLENTSSSEISKFLVYCDNNFKTLKYIPTKRDMLSISSKSQFYGYIPIIPARKFPLQKSLNKLIKRIFDIVISLFVIVFILSWMIPLIGLLIRLESKGSIFFNQTRNGLYYEEFTCYKFRSMYVNEEANTLQATKNDVRITKIGKFIRKTSIDEMPQFINVFFGNMSVCGPRPHMLKLTNEYEGKVNKFKLRHFIKPGITGMAQTHGYRGEIENNRDIVNRVKYDIFYLENWSLLLDIKIVYLTIRNAILGDKKAY